MSTQNEQTIWRAVYCSISAPVTYGEQNLAQSSVPFPPQPRIRASHGKCNRRDSKRRVRARSRARHADKARSAIVNKNKLAEPLVKGRV